MPVVFDGPRSTPELSFAVRHLSANAGIVITASHNPPHDNGYKVYFGDGAQVVEPHASGIIAKVNAIESEAYRRCRRTERGRGHHARARRSTRPTWSAWRRSCSIPSWSRGAARSADRLHPDPRHRRRHHQADADAARLSILESCAEQDEFDGRFPTVKSPNPENAEALEARRSRWRTKRSADLVIATDPDCDRMGVAVRNAAGEMELLTGNQIGSLMAYYRAKTLFEQGILNARERRARRDHQDLRHHRSAKGHRGTLRPALRGDADRLQIHRREARQIRSARCRLKCARNYRDLSEEETRRAAAGSIRPIYVCGGEESYGYSGADFVRDKDGNGAAIMFCEVAAYAKSRGLTIAELLDEVYATFGYFLEKNGSLTFEGAEGAAKIKRLVESYVSHAA